MTTERAARILVVDDDVLVRDVWCDFLMILGYDVTAAGDGDEALALFDAVRYDLVLSDLIMPRMGGRELAEALAGRSPTPVVLITGSGTAADAEQALAHAVTLLHKPVELLDLKRAVECALAVEKPSVFRRSDLRA